MRKPLILGCLLGMIFGVLISIGQPDKGVYCIGFPGVAAAVLCGKLSISSTQPGCQMVVAGVNGSFYSGIGALAGWVVARRREKTSCPKCGVQNAFRNWIGRCLPIYRCECGYDFTGNISGTCPECGTAIA